MIMRWFIRAEIDNIMINAISSIFLFYPYMRYVLSFISKPYMTNCYFSNLLTGALKLLLISFASTEQKRNKNIFVLMHSRSATSFIPFKHYSHLRLKYRTIRHSKFRYNQIVNKAFDKVKSNLPFLISPSWDEWFCWFRLLLALL